MPSDVCSFAFSSRVFPGASKIKASHNLRNCQIIDFAHQAARETNYKLELFGGVLEYTPRAMGVYEQLKVRETQQFSEERVQWLQEQYEEYRRQAIAQFRITIPPDELAAIEATVKRIFSKRCGAARMCPRMHPS